MNRMERSVCTSGLLKTRATSMTRAVPDASSFAASPQPIPSICPPTMYISPGCVVPIFVQYTSSRRPGCDGSAFSSRSRGSGCLFGSLFTPLRDSITSDPGSARPEGTCASLSSCVWIRRRGIVFIDDSFCVRAAVALELSFDPVNRFSVALCSLAPVAELGQPFDRGLVFLQPQAVNHDLDRIIRPGESWLRRRCRGGIATLLCTNGCGRPSETD